MELSAGGLTVDAQLELSAGALTVELRTEGLTVDGQLELIQWTHSWQYCKGSHTANRHNGARAGLARQHNKQNE